MAKAYLGKISALVTANTSDFNSKLNASAKEVRSFAASMQSSLSRAQSNATASLRGIYTEAQKLERALKAASSLRLSFKGFDSTQFKNIEEAADQMRRIASAAELVYKPLQSAAKVTESLSNEVRNEFAPALVLAQRQAELLNTALTRGLAVSESSFEAVERRINSTAAAIGRLKEASSAVGSLATGQELRFQRPDFVTETQRASRLQGEIASLRPQAIQDGGFAQLIAQQRAAAQETEKLASALEKARLSRNGDVAAATQAYNKQIALQRQLNDQIEREVELSKRAGEASSLGGQRTDISSRLQAARASEEEAAFRERAAEATEKQVSASNRLLAQEISRAAVLREQQQNFGAGIDTGVKSQAQNIFGGPRLEAAALRTETERLAEQFNALDAETRSLLQPLADRLNDAYQASLKSSVGVGTFADRVKSLRGELDLLNNTGLSSSIGGERTDISAWLAATKAAQEEAMFREQAAKAAQEEAMFLERAAAQSVKIADAAARRQAVRDNFGAGIDLAPQPPPEQLFGRRQRTRDSELSRTRELNRQFQALPDDVQSSLAAEAKALNNIATSAKAGAAGVETLASANDRMAASIGKANATLDAQGAKTKVLDDFRKRFADFDEALSVRSVAAFARELTVMEDVAAGVSAQFRGPMVAAMNAFRNAADRAIDSRNFDSEEVRAELALLRAEFIRTAKDAGLSGTQISNSLSRAGDVGRGGADKFSLALNQAAFAIDDFFSATGGLEFKIRAVSNNVTQLAFILGGTAGLFAGLAAVIGGQLLIAYDKFFLKSDEAKRRLEAMNEALSRQKTLAEELSQAYRALADSIERSAMSRAASQTREREQEVGGIRERQRERRGRLVAELDGRVGQREAIIAELEEKLGTEIDRFKRQAIQAQIRKLRADIEGITQAAERGADRQIDRATRQSQFTGRTRVAELRRGREDADRDLREAQLALGDNAPDNAVFRGRTLGQYREALIEFDVALQKLADNAATAALELNSQQARRAAAAQSRLEGAFGDQPSRISSTLDFAASLRRQFFEELQKGNASEEAFADFSAEISKVERVLIQAADAAASFADVLDRQVASLARAVEGDLVSAEGNARRTANRLESQLGPNDPRVVEARDNEQRLTRERQRAERERQRIDQEIEGQRARYEDELLDGRGSPADVERARRIRELDSQANSLVLTEENRRAARQEADRLRLEQQQAFESRPDIQRLRRRADEGDIEAQRELQRQESAERGRRYSMTPAQRAGEELDQQVAEIREYFSQAAENSTGLPEDVAKIRNRMNEAIARAEEDFMRQIAPVTMGLRDSVQNAVMQGPSRAALNVSDATTMEGARELNRLLRGDDSAKDADLVALQKEANAILERIAQKQNPVAN
jgi:hypothetical protein